MYKNEASQYITVYAWDSANSVPKTGDAANITAYICKDAGTPAATNDTNPTEIDATNMKGLYRFALTQAESNADMIELSPVSSTSDIQIEPVIIYTNDRTNLVDLIWDELLTSGTHNINQSAGKRLRQVASKVIRDNTAQTGTSNTITLDASASSVDGSYDPSLICIIGGTGEGQSRNIIEYNGTTKVAIVDRNWKVTPDNTSEFIIYSDAGREHVNEGLAQGGASTTITLNALASSSDDAYNGQLVFLRSGTGEDQVRLVTDYNGTTKVATVNDAWATNPDTTTGYVMLPYHLIFSEITNDVLTSAMTESYAAQGATRTVAQILYELKAYLTNFSITGTSYVAKKLDGITTAKTGTLDSATAPTENIEAP